MKIKNACQSLFFVLLLFAYEGQAQKTLSRKNPEAKYRDAVELYSQEKFSSAQLLFVAVAKEASDLQSDLRRESAYYAAVCEARLLHAHAAKSLSHFLEQYPQSTHRLDALMELATIHYTQKNYALCIETLDQIDVKDLDESQAISYHFKKAYAYFMTGKNDLAKPHFHSIRGGDSRYVPLASYYYAYILYTEGHFQTALDEFNKLKEDESFGSIVPFYIMQIYYKQGKNDLVIAEGPAVMEKAAPRRAVELSRLIGEAYYYENRYAEALPFLQTYFQKASVKPSKADDYILAYVYYQLKKYDTAAVFFQRVVAVAGDGDLMTQNALYHLGHCYVLLKQPKFAQSAFLDAAKLDIDERIQEDAFYNYAKLTYELSLSPYNESIKIFQTYLEKYPSSRYSDEIYSYLIHMYQTTRNYKDALATLDQVKRKDPRLLEAAQRITFNRGVELFQERRFEEAMETFENCILKGFDEKMTALAFFWKGESAFRAGKYDLASMAYEKALLSTSIEGEKEYFMAHYGMGYTLSQLTQYEKAIPYFLKTTQAGSRVDASLRNDAFLRLADAHFMRKKMVDALNYYEEAMKMPAFDKDYPLLQKALCLGVLGRFDEKIASLQRLIKDCPQSIFIPKAIHELAGTYLVQDKPTKAMEYYIILSTKYEKSNFGKMALLKQGLIHYNMGDNAASLKVFEKVIADYPGSPEAKEALMSIRNVYVAINRVDDFFAYVKKIGSSIKEDEQDSITFAAAENRYMDNDCEGAITSLKSYISKFPQGSFFTQAGYFLAECLRRTGKAQEALSFYEMVLKEPESYYTERSLLQAAVIANDLGDYAKTKALYTQLMQLSENPANVHLATIALMRCERKLNNDSDLREAAQRVLKLDKLTADVREDAYHALAEVAQKMGDTVQADTLFAQLLKAKNGEYQAQARYYRLEKFFRAKDYAQAEKTIFEMISEISSDYYLAKAYILWGKIYFERENYLQAKQTFQSVLDNYQGEDDISMQAQTSLNEVIAREKEIKETEEMLRRIEAEAWAEEEELTIPEI